MTQREVLKSLGEPYVIEVSGKTLYQNEVWYYLDLENEKKEKDLITQEDFSKTQLKSKINSIYFEKGLVVGWDQI